MQRRDQKNKLHIKETGDWGGGKGAVVGGPLGGAIGLLAGPVGLIDLAGAVMTESICAEIAAQLEQGGEVAYTAVSIELSEKKRP